MICCFITFKFPHRYSCSETDVRPLAVSPFRLTQHAVRFTGGIPLNCRRTVVAIVVPFVGVVVVIVVSDIKITSWVIVIYRIKLLSSSRNKLLSKPYRLMQSISKRTTTQQNYRYLTTSNNTILNY